jgi:hypothetical protein
VTFKITNRSKVNKSHLKFNDIFKSPGRPCGAALGKARQTIFGLSHCLLFGSFEPDLNIAIHVALNFGPVVGVCWQSHGL